MSRARGGAVEVPVIHHGLSLDEVLNGIGDCPACGAPKLHPRRGWEGVVWCSGCGRSFAGTPLTEIDPARGPEAWVRHGELVPPFVPPPPVPFAGRAPHLEEADDDADDAEADG